MGGLPLDVLRIILSMTSPDTVKNFSMTSKVNLRFQLDTQIWRDFFLKYTPYDRELFDTLVSGSDEKLISRVNNEMKWSLKKSCWFYPDKHLVPRGNRSMDVYYMKSMYRVCSNFYMNDYSEFIKCSSPVDPGASLCNKCERRYTIQRKIIQRQQ